MATVQGFMMPTPSAFRDNGTTRRRRRGRRRRQDLEPQTVCYLSKNTKIGGHTEHQWSLTGASCPCLTSPTLNTRNEGLLKAVGERVSSSHKSFAYMLLPPLPSPTATPWRMAPADQVSLFLVSIAVMICGSFVALVAAAIPTLNALRKVALSLEKLADAMQKELPGTMAAIRLSGMEISDLTLELSDLSQEISESVKSSARAVQAAEVGLRRMGSVAASQTLSMLQERASMPVEAVRPVVATAAESTWQAVTQAQRAVLGLTSLPVLSNWIQNKNSEEQKKIEEGMGNNDGTSQESSTEIES